MRDRLTLDLRRIENMAAGLEDIARQLNPLHCVSDSWTRPNDLRIERIPAPIGVIGMIYESRTNVGVGPPHCASSLEMQSSYAVASR